MVLRGASVRSSSVLEKCTKAKKGFRRSNSFTTEHAEKAGPTNLGWFFWEFGHEIKTYFQGQRSPDADNDGLFWVIYGHHERRLTHVHVVRDVDHISVGQVTHAGESCEITPAAIVLQDHALHGLLVAHGHAHAPAKDNIVSWWKWADEIITSRMSRVCKLM